MAFAGFYKLDNLVAIFDINRLGQSDPAPLQHHVEIYQKRCEAFGYVSGRIQDNLSFENICFICFSELLKWAFSSKAFIF